MGAGEGELGGVLGRGGGADGEGAGAVRLEAGPELVREVGPQVGRERGGLDPGANGGQLGVGDLARTAREAETDVDAVIGVGGEKKAKVLAIRLK